MERRPARWPQGGARRRYSLRHNIPGPPARAQDDSGPTTLFGAVDLIGTPSARWRPDGELSVGASFLKNNQHYNLGFPNPALAEAVSVIRDCRIFFPGIRFIYDRASALKVRLWTRARFSRRWRVGSKDIVGTGVYNGEYIVASKRFGDVDTSLGIGWGRRARNPTVSKNPLANVFPSFAIVNLFWTSGQADFKAFFRGPRLGCSVGAVWHYATYGLALSIEYDSDTYALENSSESFSPQPGELMA